MKNPFSIIDPEFERELRASRRLVVLLFFLLLVLMAVAVYTLPLVG